MMNPALFNRTIILLLSLMLPLLSSCNSYQSEQTFRVMSYNIAAGHGDLDRIAEVIAEYEPDIVALQEVDVYWSDRSDFEDQASYLGETLGMHSFFGEIYTLEPLEETMPPRQYGLAFLSRFPFAHTENHPVTRLSTQTDDPHPELLPGFPGVSVEVSGCLLHLFNTHLDYRPDPAIREMQVAEMLSIMEKPETPILLLGDLNARPGSPELDPLFMILRDAWATQAGPGYTFPSDNPDRRIDYILHTEHFRVKEILVPEVYASDHLPVVADFILSRRL